METSLTEDLQMIQLIHTIKAQMAETGVFEQFKLKIYVWII